MRYFIFLLLPFFAASQNCSICPAGSAQLNSSFPATATHQWTCTNGFSSNLQNPTITVADDVTCTLVASEGGCTSTSTSIIDVCDCTCNNNACTSISYNSSTDCVTFADTGTPCSPISSQSLEWRNITSMPWTAIPVSNQVCDCNIKEYVNTTAAVSVVSGNFRLQINGLKNRCATCSGSAMQIDFVFGVTGWNSTLFPGCAGTTDWYTISAANFAAAGYVANAYVKYTTPWGVVVNHYRFSYNGGGLNATNVTVTTVSKKSIYKKIETKRTINFTNGCPQVVCQNEYQIPQQPNDPCSNFFGYITTVNLGSPCSGAGLSASTVNAVAPINYQWKYNGTIISGATSQFFCLVGQPNGTYCCVITDNNGCTDDVCIIVQPPCALSVNVTSAGNTLTATLSNCTGTPTYQWARWNGSTWVTVGTNSNTYNTGGLSGDYRVTVNCTGCSAIGYITFVAPCSNTINITIGTTTLTANVAGCGGASIVYVWDRWNGISWVQVATTTTTSTSNVYTPTQSGLYRVTATCSGCSATAQASFTLPNPCTGFSVIMTGNNGPLCVGTTYTYGRNITGGTAPFTNYWTVNGLGSGTGTTMNLTPLAAGTQTIQVVVTDNNGCTAATNKVVTSNVCCGMTLTINPTSTTVCTNQDATFTVTPSGGTAPYTYSWTYNLQPSGPIIGAGSGNPKTLNISTAGTYNVVCTVTDAVGCQTSIFSILTVNTCTNCTCTPTLALAGCVLNGSFAGAGCGNFNYQLQYSATGTGWSVAASGTASNGGSFTHAPTVNGFYRLVIVAANCTLQQTQDVSVNCVPTCNCTAGTLTYNPTTCQISWNNPCSGYIANLQKQNGASWTFITNTSPYTNPANGVYRVQYQKGGCSDVFTNQVTVSIPTCNYFQYYDSDLMADVYYPKIAVPDFNFFYGFGNTVINRFTCSNGYCDYPWNSSYFTNSTIIWGDGSSNYTTSTTDYSIHHTYAANGTYKIEYDRSSTFGLTEVDLYTYPNGTIDVPAIAISPNCGDGGVPIYYTLDGCDNINLYIQYNVGGGHLSAATYTSHTVTINGTSYTVPLVQNQGPPSVSWLIYNTSPIVLSKSAINNTTIPINISVTINGNQVLTNKGYFRIECN